MSNDGADPVEPELTPEWIEARVRSVIQTLASHYMQLRPGKSANALVDEYVGPMLACPDTDPVSRRKLLEDAASNGNAPAVLDALLLAAEYCVVAIKACRIKRPGRAWSYLSQAMLYAGVVQSMQSPLGPPRSASIAEGEERLHAMRAMRDAGKSDSEIARAFDVSRTTVGKQLGKRQR